VIPDQGLEMLSGALTALVYAAAVIGVGVTALRAALGSERFHGSIREEGRGTAVVLAFVVGQGLVGLGWLVLALAGMLTPHSVGLFVLFGCLALWLSSRGMWAGRETEVSPGADPAFYRWLRRGLLLLLVLRSLAALLPTKNDDALITYLVTPLMVAFTHALRLQPSVPLHGLMPLQVETHWAALFSVSHETAVTFWDYLCSLGTLGALAAIARHFSSDGRVRVVALLMMLTTTGFILLMGAGKPDNASTQFALAALLWILIAPLPSPRAFFLSGLCVGWALGSRYTAFVVIPAWLVLLLRRARLRPTLLAPAALGAALAWGPMLFKNWLLVRNPLAPLFGDPDSPWTWQVPEHAWNLSWLDVLVHPFVWTFADRRDMLGNISPLFVGLFAPWVLFRKSPAVRRSRGALALGALIILTWLVVETRALHTRFLLPGLALAAVGLAPAFVAMDDALWGRRALQVTARLGLATLLGFWVTVSSWEAWGALRYATGLDGREDRYRRKEGYDAAVWLNENVPAASRVSLMGFGPVRYLLRPDILQNAESTAELTRTLAAARSQPWPAALAWLARSGRFSHIVVDRALIGSLADPSQGLHGHVAFTGDRYAVLRLDGNARPRLTAAAASR
jgi:dolichyl-phosphate-mannose-protein mannosyltransferase